MKNKKTLVWFITAAILILAAVAVFAAPALFDSTPQPGTGSVTFSLTVTAGGDEVIWSNEVTVTEGTSLIDAAAANITENGGVVWSDGQYGAYITSICGLSENHETCEYWVFTVNGEQVMVGASEYTPASGDDVVFDLSPLVW